MKKIMRASLCIAFGILLLIGALGLIYLGNKQNSEMNVYPPMFIFVVLSVSSVFIWWGVRALRPGATKPKLQCAYEESIAEQLELDTQLSRERWMTTGVLMLANIIPYLLFNVRFGFAVTTPSPEEMVAFGGNLGPLTAQGQLWRLFTAMFLHYGPTHLALNLFALWSVGRFIDYYLGKRTLIALFLTSGLFGSLASVLWNASSVSAGASGAIFGLYGSLLGVYFSPREVVHKKIPRWALFGTLYFVIHSISRGLTSNQVDNAAHLGGLISGFLITTAFLRFKINDLIGRAAVSSMVVGSIMICQFVVFPRMEKLGPEALATFSARSELQRVSEVFVKFEAFQKSLVFHVEQSQFGDSSEAQLISWVTEQGLPQMQQIEKDLRSLELKDTDLKELQNVYVEFYQSMEERLRTIIQPPKKRDRSLASTESIEDKAAHANEVAQRVLERFRN